MATKPVAIELFNSEIAYSDETSSILFEHPVERLKMHILTANGKILRFELNVDGSGRVEWEEGGEKYAAWSIWPDARYKVDWKRLS